MNVSVPLIVPHTKGEMPNDTLQWGFPAQWTMSDKKSVKQLPQSCLDATLSPQSAGYINSIVHESIHFRTDQQACEHSIWNVRRNHAFLVWISHNCQVKSTALVIHVKHQLIPYIFHIHAQKLRVLWSGDVCACDA